MSDFEIDLSRSKSTCVLPARRGEHDGVIFVFISFIPKTLFMKNHLRGKIHLMTSAAKIVDLMSNLIENVTGT